MATRGRMVRDPGPEQVEEAKAQLKLIELGWGNENSAFRQLHTSQLMPDATAEQARAFNDLMRQTTTPANAAKLLQTHWTEADNRSLAPRQLPNPRVARPAGLASTIRGRSIACRAHSWRPLRTAREPQPYPGRGRAGLAATRHPAGGFLACPHPCEIDTKAASSTGLTPREAQVLELIAQGSTTPPIGASSASASGRPAITCRSVRQTWCQRSPKAIVLGARRRLRVQTVL